MWHNFHSLNIIRQSNVSYINMLRSKWSSRTCSDRTIKWEIPNLSPGIIRRSVSRRYIQNNLQSPPILITPSASVKYPLINYFQIYFDHIGSDQCNSPKYHQSSSFIDINRNVQIDIRATKIISKWIFLFVDIFLEWKMLGVWLAICI